jgi:hypothetical protein
MAIIMDKSIGGCAPPIALCCCLNLDGIAIM